MIAERENEKVQSRKASVLIAVAKARVWAGEGWKVVVADGDGKIFPPAEFDRLYSLGKSTPAANTDDGVLGRHDHLADRPQRDARELQMRPGEGNADDGHGE